MKRHYRCTFYQALNGNCAEPEVKMIVFVFQGRRQKKRRNQENEFLIGETFPFFQSWSLEDSSSDTSLDVTQTSFMNLIREMFGEKSWMKMLNFTRYPGLLYPGLLVILIACRRRCRSKLRFSRDVITSSGSSPIFWHKLFGRFACDCLESSVLPAWIGFYFIKCITTVEGLANLQAAVVASDEGDEIVVREQLVDWVIELDVSSDSAIKTGSLLISLLLLPSEIVIDIRRPPDAVFVSYVMVVV